MSWNYRIVYKDGMYAMKEVYYDENGIPNSFCDASLDGYDRVSDMRDAHLAYSAAFLKPVLVWNEKQKRFKEKRR